MVGDVQKQLRSRGKGGRKALAKKAPPKKTSMLQQLVEKKKALEAAGKAFDKKKKYCQ